MVRPFEIMKWRVSEYLGGSKGCKMIGDRYRFVPTFILGPLAGVYRSKEEYEMKNMCVSSSWIFENIMT